MPRLALIILALTALLALLAAAAQLEAVQATLRLLGRWLLDQQRAWQTALALDLRGVAAGQSTGQAAALAGLLGACLAYGFLHAAGPGHGKAVLAAHAAARPATARRIALVGLAAGLLQATFAVALALGLAALAGLSRARIDALDNAMLAPLGLAAAMALGLWLMVRAALRLGRTVPAPAPAAPVRIGPAQAMLAARRGGPAPQATVWCADPGCADCGRPHLPDAARLARGGGAWETLAVIAAAAVRPCSGALFLLLLAWQMGVLWVGILGTYAMGLGTAAVTVALALAAGAGRAGLMRAAAGPAAPRLAALLEAGAGLVLILGAAAVLAALA